MTTAILVLLAALLLIEAWSVFIGAPNLVACIRQEVAQEIANATVPIDDRLTKINHRQNLDAVTLGEVRSRVETLLECSGSMVDGAAPEDPQLTARVLGGVRNAAEGALARQREPAYPLDEVRLAATPPAPDPDALASYDLDHIPDED